MDEDGPLIVVRRDALGRAGQRVVDRAFRAGAAEFLPGRGDTAGEAAAQRISCRRESGMLS